MCSNLEVHLLSAVWGFNHRSVGVLAGEIDASGGDYGLVNGPSGQLWTRPALLARLPANTPASQENLESLMACT